MPRPLKRKDAILQAVPYRSIISLLILAIAACGNETARWSEPQSFGQANVIGDPRIDVDGSGSAFVAWEEAEGEQLLVRMRRFQKGVGWEPIRLIARVTRPDSERMSRPRLAVAEDGAALLVWNEAQDSTSRLMASSFTPGSLWTAPRSLATHEDVQSSAEVVTGRAGTFLVVWDTVTAIWALVMERGDKLGPVELVDQGGENVRLADLALNPYGEAVARWTQDFSDGLRINVTTLLSRRSPDGIWERPVSLGSTRGRIDASRLMFDGQGGLFVLIQSSDPFLGVSPVAAYLWPRGEGLISIGGLGTRTSSLGQACALEDGKILALISSIQSDPPTLSSAVYDGGWSALSSLPGEPLGELQQRAPNERRLFIDVAGGPQRGAVAVWASSFWVRSASYDADSGWRDPEDVRTESGPYRQHLALAISRTGERFAAWVETSKGENGAPALSRLMVSRYSQSVE